jgi:MFS family permease
VQGVVLVTFPAASTIFTDPAEYDLSSTQYGTLFLPQVITAVAAALAGAGLGRRFGTKRVYLAGLVHSRHSGRRSRWNASSSRRSRAGCRHA